MTILVISSPHASADGEKCTTNTEALKKFQPLIPAKMVKMLAFSDAEGADHTFADYKGFGLVVNFWATWCVPCVREMPTLDRLQPMVKKDGIKVLTISEDRGGVEVVKKFFKRKKIINLPVLLDKRGRLMRYSGILGLPATLLIDSQGRERGRVVGTAEWDAPEVVDFIKKCLRP